MSDRDFKLGHWHGRQELAQELKERFRSLARIRRDIGVMAGTRGLLDFHEESARLILRLIDEMADGVLREGYPPAPAAPTPEVYRPHPWSP